MKSALGEVRSEGGAGRRDVVIIPAGHRSSWEDGACGGAAIIAVVGCYHGKVSVLSEVENGWREGEEELWDFIAVADCSAIATTVDGKGVVR